MVLLVLPNLQENFLYKEFNICRIYAIYRVVFLTFVEFMLFVGESFTNVTVLRSYEFFCSVVHS